MNKINLTILLLVMPGLALAGISVIYGQDNRKDIYQVTNASYLKLADSTAALVSKQHFTKGLTATTFDLSGAPTLEEGQNVCAAQTFSQQPLAATCSGFLVAPDIIVTAGHCYKAFDTPENVCKNFAWVFGFGMKTATSDPTKSITIDNIYQCKSVIKAQLDSENDFSVIKLDRKVVGRTPLKVRTSGKIDAKAALVVIGHPTGLPTKISDGGKIISNADKNSFLTNLDTFQGNSGSAVFNTATNVVEGILIQGKTDYLLSNPSNEMSCLEVNKCDENGQNCLFVENSPFPILGEKVLRIEKILKYLPVQVK